MSPDDAEQARDRIRSTIPMGRYGEPEEIAKVMLFLASDDSEFITGTVMMADLPPEPSAGRAMRGAGQLRYDRWALRYRTDTQLILTLSGAFDDRRKRFGSP